MVSTVFLTSHWCIISAQGFPSEPSSRTWVTDRVFVRFETEYRSTPRWASLRRAAFQWELALATSTRASSSIFSRNEKLDADRLEDLLNHQSGLFALSSGESDVKTLEERARSNDPKARLALDVFAISVRKTIGAFVALLRGVDLLVFTGGIGEHSDHIRSAATHGLDSIGLTPDKIQIVPTQEERQIARHCREMMKDPSP